MDLEKKLVLKKQLISAAALLPSAFAAVYFAYCLMLGRINIFAELLETNDTWEVK